MTRQLATIELVDGLAWIGGLAVLAGMLALLTAALYRWYVRDTVPEGLPVLIGLAGVAISLNTTAALGQVIGGRTGLFDIDAALVNVATFAVAAAAALLGRRVGDRMAAEMAVMSGAGEIDAEVGRLVRTVGRVVPVTLPEAEEIEDIEGYDPVPPGTKEAMAGETLLFPRRLTVAELRDRLVTRLKDDYGVGYVGVELADDGTLEYLAVGSRASGIGPTLPVGTGAVAIRADPPFAATSGDVVQVWTDGGEPERIATAELRGKADDVVTLALDEAEAEALDPERGYRLVTMPAGGRPDREFAALLRAADETMGVATIEEGSPLVGRSLSEFDAQVVAVRPAGGTVEAIPPRGRTLAVEDTVYAIGRPEALRRLETAAGPGGETEAESSS